MSPFIWIQIAAGAVVVALVGLLFLRRPEGEPAWRRRLLAAGLLGLWGLGFLRQPPEPDPVTKQQVIDRFHQIFYDATNTWYKAHWCGVNTWQNPNDVWIHQEIISEVKPDVIVEAGTHEGGSAVIWALVLSQVNPQGRIVTIDIVDKVTAAKKLPIFQDKVEFLLGSSTDPKIVDEVKKRCAGKKVLVILDSLHQRDHVLSELRAYSPLVPLGSYVIVQDTNINGHPVYPTYGPGPWEAVDDFLKENDQFVPDPERERLLFTMHPRGYLKRVK